MTFTERFTDVITDLGDFSLPINPDLAPLDGSLERINGNDYLILLPVWFQHPEAFLDADLLAMARYVGKVIEPERSLDEHKIVGHGIAIDLGDSEAGPRYAPGFSFNAAPPSVVLDDVNGLLQIGGVTAGTITDTAALVYGDGSLEMHLFETVRQALDIYLKTVNGHARVNYNGTLDMCATSRDDVYRVTNPIMVATRYGWGLDPGPYIGLHCQKMVKRIDVSRLATHAWYIDRATGFLLASSDRNYGHRDLHGTDIQRTILTESLPDGITEALYLQRELDARSAAIQVDIYADQLESIFRNMTGDNIYVFSPEDGLMNIDNEINFRGQKMWPMIMQVTETTFPFADWMGAYIRPSGTNPAGPAKWIDITKAAVPEYRPGQSFSKLTAAARLPQEEMDV